ncbi:hypothetical protein [Pseudomonas sp. 273]|uniref:hypothetical protein n=1 Tax=Pseudomonas sp. 273 TaxID=75692 RepID=UPI0023D8C0F5|nr:hypothetical protein [Pseudomonas sp. 273]
MAKPLGSLARKAMDRARRIAPAPARRASKEKAAPAAPVQTEQPAAPAPAEVQQAGPRLDRVLFLEGRRAAQDFLRGFAGMLTHHGKAQEVFQQLRKGASSRPASFAAGMESLIAEVEALIARHENARQQNVARHAGGEE